MILSFSLFGTGAAPSTLLLGGFSAVALAAYASAMLLGERWKPTLRALLVAGWLAHALALATDIAGVGSDVVAARFGFAPALSMTIWLVLAVYLVESRFLPLPGARRILALLGILVVVLAWWFPGEVRPQAPSRWATLHWILGIASYGLFGAAVLHAAMLGQAERQLRHARSSTPSFTPAMPLLRLERITFDFVGAGFVVLSAAIVLGIGTAHPWRWDHKAVFSMLGWVIFAGLLAGRRAFGWRGSTATRGVYAGAGMLLLAYVGSRFVLEVLLHRAPAL